MKKRKRVIKVTEIPSKVKEVKEIKKESELEEEIEQAESGFSSDFSSSGAEFVSGILASEESRQESEERPAQAAQRRDEPEFSQTRVYNTPQAAALTEEERRARYVTQEQAMRRINPSLSQSNVNFSPQSRHEDFVSPELQRLRGEEDDHKYNEIFGEKEQKPKRRYPWEAN